MPSTDVTIFKKNVIHVVVKTVKTFRASNWLLTEHYLCFYWRLELAPISKIIDNQAIIAWSKWLPKYTYLKVSKRENAYNFEARKITPRSSKVKVADKTDTRKI